MTSGFSLVETMVCLGIATILISISLPGSIHTLQKIEAQTDRETLVDVLRNARANSLAHLCEETACTGSSNQGPTPFGVFLTPTTATLFKGNTYTQRIKTDDVPFSFKGTRAITGSTEVIFFPDGTASSTSSSIKEVGVDYEVQTVTINEQGQIATSIQKPSL